MQSIPVRSSCSCSSDDGHLLGASLRNSMHITLFVHQIWVHLVPTKLIWWFILSKGLPWQKLGKGDLIPSRGLLKRHKHMPEP